MPLTEVMLVNPKTSKWGGRKSNPGINIGGTLGQLKTQFKVGGGIRGVVGTMAGISVCGFLAPKFAKKWGEGWKGVAVSGLTALAGGLLINRFSKDKTFGTMFTIGGLGMTGWMVLARLYPPARKFSPFAGLGVGTGLYSEELFGLGDELGDDMLDEDVLMDDIAPFSPEAELWSPATAGDRMIRTAFNAADEAIEGYGDIGVIDDDLVPTYTGLE